MRLGTSEVVIAVDEVLKVDELFGKCLGAVCEMLSGCSGGNEESCKGKYFFVPKLPTKKTSKAGKNVSILLSYTSPYKTYVSCTNRCSLASTIQFRPKTQNMRYPRIN